MASAEKTSEMNDKPDEQKNIPAVEVGATAVNETTPTKPVSAVQEADDDSDYEDLDEVLDDFNKPKQPAATTAAASSNLLPDTSTPSLGEENIDEEALLKQLEAEMATLLGGAGKAPQEPAEKGSAGLGDDALDELAKNLVESGVNPEDFIKKLLSASGEPGPSSSKKVGDAGKGASSSSSPADLGGERGTFNDTIQRTLERMRESGDKVTADTVEEGSDADIMQRLMKVFDAAMNVDDTGTMDDMFMGIMKQLSTKEVLYVPVKELQKKIGPWLAENKDKISAEDLARYERQDRISREAVAKFEEEGYSDDDPECRAYIWERMQELQETGNMPDGLLENSWLDEEGPASESGPIPPECPQQ